MAMPCISPEDSPGRPTTMWRRRSASPRDSGRAGADRREGPSAGVEDRIASRRPSCSAGSPLDVTGTHSVATPASARPRSTSCAPDLPAAVPSRGCRSHRPPRGPDTSRCAACNDPARRRNVRFAPRVMTSTRGIGMPPVASVIAVGDVEPEIRLSVARTAELGSVWCDPEVTQEVRRVGQHGEPGSGNRWRSESFDALGVWGLTGTSLTPRPAQARKQLPCRGSGLQGHQAAVEDESRGTGAEFVVFRSAPVTVEQWSVRKIGTQRDGYDQPPGPQLDSARIPSTVVAEPVADGG
jgi:hypothetical protein